MKRTKRVMSLLGISALAFTMMFSGCGKKEAAKQKTDQPAKTAEQSSKQAEKSSAKYPTKAVQIIVPYKAGGATDVSARLLAAALEKEMGQPFVIVNVDGIGGSVGAKKVKEAEKDGYTILWAHNGLAVNKIMNITDYSFDGFEVGPIAFTDYSNGLFSSTKGKIKDMATLVEEAKKNPGKLTYGTEFGSFTHLQAVALEGALGIKFNIVDVGPDADKKVALLGGQIDVAPGLFTTYKAQVDSKDFNYLCVLPAQRNQFLPNVPTLKEQGFNHSWDGYTFGMFFPKGTPKEITSAVGNAVEKITKDKGFQDEITKKFMTVSYKNPDEAAKYWNTIQESYDKYKDKMLAAKKK